MTLRLLLITILLCSPLFAENLLLKNARVYDGTGSKPFRADVRIAGDRIIEVKPSLRPRDGEKVRDLGGLALAPGFIDMHSHADRKLLESPDAANAVLQGITTILVGQDGGSMFPLAEWFEKLEKTRTGINVASMAGHATIRRQVMGEDLYRDSTAEELARMRDVLAKELAAGAFGLSTGLEYESAHFSSTEEIIELSRVAATRGGFYISHVRDEANKVFDSFDEVIEIGRRARLPVQITHVKLGSVPVWHLAAKRMPAVFEKAKREGVNVKADVYPYTRWQSTLRVIVPDRDWFNAEKVKNAIADNGGPERLLITRFSPDPSVGGKTLSQVAEMWKVTPVEAYMRLIKATFTADGKEDDKIEESVIGESISEDDVRWFIAHPLIMFCTDGELHGKHPRGAGAFPRILGRYVREQKVIPLEEAVRKATSLPAAQLGLKDRGRIAIGYAADLVVFDPAWVIDRSTIENPEAPPAGIPHVMIAGEWVVDNGQITGARPGRVLRHHQ